MNSPRHAQDGRVFQILNRFLERWSTVPASRIRAVEQSKQREQWLRRICAGWDIGLGVVIAGGTVAMFAHLLDSTLGMWLRTWASGS